MLIKSHNGAGKELRGLLGHATRRWLVAHLGFFFSFSVCRLSVCVCLRWKMWVNWGFWVTFTIQMPHVSLFTAAVNDWREFSASKSRRQNDLKEIIESFLDRNSLKIGSLLWWDWLEFGFVLGKYRMKKLKDSRVEKCFFS